MRQLHNQVILQASILIPLQILMYSNYLVITNGLNDHPNQTHSMSTGRLWMTQATGDTFTGNPIALHEVDIGVGGLSRLWGEQNGSREAVGTRVNGNNMKNSLLHPTSLT